MTASKRLVMATNLPQFNAYLADREITVTKAVFVQSEHQLAGHRGEELVVLPWIGADNNSSKRRYREVQATALACGIKLVHVDS